MSLYSLYCIRTLHFRWILWFEQSIHHIGKYLANCSLIELRVNYKKKFWELLIHLVHRIGKEPSSDSCIPPDDFANETARVTYNSEWEVCPHQHALVPLLSAIYMLLTNVLLMNLLIAMFRLHILLPYISQKNIFYQFVR